MDVTRELVLPASPEEVWEALIDPERLEEWFANEVELDLERGEGIFRWQTGEVRRARIEEIEVGRRLRFRWSADEAFEGETEVAFTLEEAEEGTRLLVREAAPEPKACAGGWAAALELRALLAGASVLV